MNDRSKNSGIDIKTFCLELADLMEKHRIGSIGVAIEGDTHGINNHFEICAEHESWHGQDGIKISYYASHVDPHDLREFAS